MSVLGDDGARASGFMDLAIAGGADSLEVVQATLRNDTSPSQAVRHLRFLLDVAVFDIERLE